MTELSLLVTLSLWMPVTAAYLATYPRDVARWSPLIAFGKFLFTVAAGVLFPYPAGTSLVVTAGPSQTVECSFIPGVLGTPA